MSGWVFEKSPGINALWAFSAVHRGKVTVGMDHRIRRRQVQLSPRMARSLGQSLIDMADEAEADAARERPAMEAAERQ